MWDAPASTSTITMALCITLSISPSVHAVLLSFLPSFHLLRQGGDVLAGTAAPPHIEQHHAMHELHLLRQCGDAPASTSSSPTMLSDGGVELARYRPIHAIHLGCRWGRQALLLRSVASSAELMLSYILQVARSRAGASTVPCSLYSSYQHDALVACGDLCVGGDDAVGLRT